MGRCLLGAAEFEEEQEKYTRRSRGRIQRAKAHGATRSGRLLFLSANDVPHCHWPVQTRHSDSILVMRTHTHTHTSYVNTRLCTGVRDGDG